MGTRGRGWRKLRQRDTEWSRLRVSADVSIRELEAATGIHRTTLSMLERGRYLPTPDDAGKIMAALTRLQAEKAAATLSTSATIEG